MSRKPIMRKFLVTWTLFVVGHFLIGFAASPASAQGFENLDRIDNLVATAVGANIGQPGGAIAPVDRRLHLAACPQLAAIEGPVFGAAIVRCDRLGWRIRVPLSTTAAQAYSHPQQRVILIKKGDPVQLVAGDATFTVAKSMIADEDGAVGDMIRVREDKNSAPVSGRVEPNGVVRIPGI
jgi:flagella basal body P-ring formation protein FlgA